MMYKHALLGALCSLFAASVCAQPVSNADESNTAVPASDDQREITIIEADFPYNLDPYTANYSSEAQILIGLYEGLFSYDPATLDPIPALCTSYKISRDKKRWTFTLRTDATFSDGEPITAQTFRDSWLTLLSTPEASFASLLDCIEGAAAFRAGTASADDVRITVRNDYTLVVHLAEPAEHLSKILCHYAFAAISKNEHVYSGAFVLKSYKDKLMTLEKNQKYYDAKNVRIPSIKIMLSADIVENAHAYNTGEADWVAGAVDSTKILNPDSIHISAEFGTHYLFFKGQNEPWNNPDFRRALLEAIPYDNLRKGYFVPATTLVYPLNGYPTVQGITEYDPEDAVELMNAARDKANIPRNKKIPLVFAITDNEYMRTWAELLKTAWEPLGVELTVQITPMERYNASISGWNADLFSYSWIGDFADPLAFLELFRGGSSLNISSFNDATYNQLLVEAARAENTNERYKLLAQAEQLLLDKGMIIPITHPISLHVIDLNMVGGWQINALDLHPLKYLYIKQTCSQLPNLVYLR